MSASFQEVVKQLHRLCEQREHRCFITKTINRCPLFESFGDISICIAKRLQTMDNPAIVEEIVMKWAADHPEPVYPTWGQYFCSTCQMPVDCDGLYNYDKVMNSHIPNDIAQKLGLKPI